jgi:predicted TIM-barrel fold metal-dependent hydrolase
MRKIDVFTHILPERYVERMQQVAPSFKDVGKRVRGVPMLVDLDVRFRIMDAHDGYQQILSMSTPPVDAFARGADAVDLAQRGNDGMAELVDRHPDRFPGFIASLPMNDVDAAMQELERSISALGARGIQLCSNVSGSALDAPDFQPIFAAMAAYDLPVWLHPYRNADIPDYTTESRSEYEIWWTFGWPYETSVAMARLVFSGLFDRYPDLKVITHHMGAMIPYFEGRIGPGCDQLGVRTSDRDYRALLKQLKKRPFDYFKMFYADTALFGGFEPTVCGLRFFGVDQVLFASDAPFDPEGGSMYIRETIGVVDRLPVTEGEREQIYWRNAVRLLKLDTPGGQSS